MINTISILKFPSPTLYKYSRNLGPITTPTVFPPLPSTVNSPNPRIPSNNKKEETSFSLYFHPCDPCSYETLASSPPSNPHLGSIIKSNFINLQNPQSDSLLSPPIIISNSLQLKLSSHRSRISLQLLLRWELFWTKKAFRVGSGSNSKRNRPFPFSRLSSCVWLQEDWNRRHFGITSLRMCISFALLCRREFWGFFFFGGLC